MRSYCFHFVYERITTTRTTTRKNQQYILFIIIGHSTVAVDPANRYHIENTIWFFGAEEKTAALSFTMIWIVMNKVN